MNLFLRSFSSLPLNYSRRVVVSHKWKYVHKVLVNNLFKIAQEKVWLGELTVPPWPWKLLTWDVKQQNKQTNKLFTRVVFHVFVVCWYFFFQIQLFRKNISGIPSVSNSLDPDQFKSGLVWIQIVTSCQSYRQTALVDKELISIQLNHFIVSLPELKLVLMNLRLKELPSI